MLPRFHPRHRLKAWPIRRPFDPYLVAYYSGLPGSSAILYDEGPYGNHGTWTPATWADGKIRPAPKFDGLDDYVFVSHHSSLAPSSALTIEMWVYWNQGGTATQTHLLRKEGSYGMWIERATNRPWGRIWQSDDTLKSLPRTLTMALATWHHLALVADPDALLVQQYLNGILNSQIAYDGTIKVNTNDVYIGSNETPLYFFGDKLCQLRIYSRALSEAEILRHYLRLA